MTRVSRALAVVATAGSLALAALPATAAAQSPACQSASVPVTVALLVPAQMAGTLCMPASGEADTVMVLVPGATYNHTYWDFPYQPDTYNFRQVMNEAGYATFVLDRLGAGASSRPLSLLLSTTVQAKAVHRVISALRAGQIGGHAFTKVIGGGHSLGAGIALVEAAYHGGVDGLLLTGFSHQVNPLGLPLLDLYPATLDPKFAGQGYDPGYLTSMPGLRDEAFYAPGFDPNVVAVDEQTKDVVAGTELADLAVWSSTPDLGGIDVPVLIANGDLDALMCNPVTHNCDSAQALKDQESLYFQPGVTLTTFLLPGAGHDINLSPGTTDYQDAVVDWADASIGN